jgi:transposase
LLCNKEWIDTTLLLCKLIIKFSYTDRVRSSFSENVCVKMMPPNNISISKLSIEMGIGESTLYNWRKQAIDKGYLVPGDGKNAEQWSSANKFAVVLETATLNQAELARYCRKKGLYTEQIASWRSACMDANAHVKVQEKAFSIEAKKDKKQIN